MSGTKRPGNGEVLEGLALAHGAFNVIGGLWPLLHRRSFEWFFGPKTDQWLQTATGALLVSTGISQIAAASTAEGQAHARRAGLGSSLSLLSVDLLHVPRGTIRPTYLVDAALEAAWIAAWISMPAPAADDGRRRR
ncbi:hypothetical protein PJ985_20945 [Streptomyces sp. ACA25]|uniref:hypothetical protein n=1 Tax=Streptomyces sp. ACA25 TaxID=3022596 RepID=UPI002307875D|nr:hypothetical protein [Streptomyces sp. ACA25]MDB1090030.1 hypothetical protein [Streptomyces sp. ACA25]